MQNLIARIAACQQWNPESYRPFLVGEHSVGHVPIPLLPALQTFPDIFVESNPGIALSPTLRDASARTQAMDKVAHALQAHGTIKGWRAEYYDIAPRFGASPLLKLERAAMPLFGARSYGVHVNGFVGLGRDQKIWLAHRSRSKATFPGALDHLIAGGMGSGYGALETVVKEAEEEAGIPAHLAAVARPAGAWHYRTELPGEIGLRDDVIFIYDLMLPATFIPENQDGEVESFELVTPEHLMALLQSDADFKFNVAPIFIDFLIRHGHLTPETPGYLDIVSALRNQPITSPHRLRTSP